jgi:hypothetical protein
MNNTDQQTSNPPPRTGWGFIVVLVGLLLCSMLLAFAGYASVADSLQFNRTRDRIWGIAGLACAAAMLIASLLLLINLWLKHKSLAYVSTALLAFSTLGNCALVAQGIAVVNDAKFRGGDWGALHVGMARLFNVYLPFVLIFFCGAVTAFCISQLRPEKNSSP